jgi:hypothetical protein
MLVSLKPTVVGASNLYALRSGLKHSQWLWMGRRKLPRARTHRASRDSPERARRKHERAVAAQHFSRSTLVLLLAHSVLQLLACTAYLAERLCPTEHRERHYVKQPLLVSRGRQACLQTLL